MSIVATIRAAALGLLVAGSAGAAEVQESPEIAAAFDEAKVVGTFVVRDADGNLVGYNAARADERFVPASTFKIANTLIGLDCGAVSSVDEIFPYDGEKRRFPQWEKAMGLRDAIRVSNVPVYQDLARRIELERMSAGVVKLNYGNGEIGNVVDRFWLDGPLKISAVEQVDFLGRLAAGDVEFSPEAIAAVHEITKLEPAGDAAVHGKTGWGDVDSVDIGWFVGWVERDGTIFPFALNLEMTGDELLPVRESLARECLRRVGIIE